MPAFIEIKGSSACCAMPTPRNFIPFRRTASAGTSYSARVAALTGDGIATRAIAGAAQANTLAVLFIHQQPAIEPQRLSRMLDKDDEVIR